MKTFERIQIGRKRINIDQAELTKINAANGVSEFTVDDVAAKRLYAVEAVLIDSAPTKNRNQYMPEWQASMEKKWIGSKLVYSEEDHKPNAPDEYGWIYDSWLETESGNTSTVARIVVPVISSTAPVVERLRAGLSQAVSIGAYSEEAVCGECSAPVNLATGRCQAHRSAVTKYTKGKEPIHVALVADPGSTAARIRATSETAPDMATGRDIPLELMTDEARLLIEDGRRVREPVITEAVRFARLIDPNRSVDDLTARFEKWSLAEISMYRDTQKATYESRNPQASTQLSVADATDESTPEWKPLDQIVKRNKR